jgi:hypothetical protein
VVDAAALQLGQLVAQRADAGRCRFGPAAQAGEVVARMRLEGQHAGRQPAVAGFIGQQGQHGLVAPVHAVKVADGQRTGRYAQVESAVNAHGARLSGVQSQQIPVQREVGLGGAVPVELRRMVTHRLRAAGVGKAGQALLDDGAHAGGVEVVEVIRRVAADFGQAGAAREEDRFAEVHGLDGGRPKPSVSEGNRKPVHCA